MNEEYTEINLVDLLALVFKKFNVFVLAAVVGLILGVGINYLSVSQPSKMAAYEASLAEYEETLKGMEEELEDLENRYERQKEVNDAYSVLLKKSMNEGNSESILLTYSDNVKAEGETYTQITKKSEALEKFKATMPSKPAPSFVKFGLIGAFVGIFVMLCVYCFPFIFKMPVTSSYSFEDKTKVPFMGALFADNKFWSKVARKMIGERDWKTEEEAVDFVKENVASNIGKNSKIALVSSVSEADVKEAVNKTTEILKGLGHEVVFVPRAYQNPSVFSATADADYVVVLERQWASSSNKAIFNIEKAKASEKPVAGFILC